MTNDPEKAQPEALSADIGHRDEEPHWRRVEDYGGGIVQARHGRINLWLAVVYAILFAWALYYGWVYWGGLGPGLNY
jgi:hypothetical protein